MNTIKKTYLKYTAAKIAKESTVNDLGVWHHPVLGAWYTRERLNGWGEASNDLIYLVDQDQCLLMSKATAERVVDRLAFQGCCYVDR